MPFTFYVRDTPTYVFGFTVRYPGGSLKFSTVPEDRERKINGIVSPIKITLPCAAMKGFWIDGIEFFHSDVRLPKRKYEFKGRDSSKYLSPEPDIVSIVAKTMDMTWVCYEETTIEVEVHYEGHVTKSGRSIDEALDSDYTVSKPGSCVEHRTRYLECKNCRLKVLWDKEGYGDHKWGSPTYTWNEDHSACTAVRQCKNDESHTETANAEVSQSETPPTCTSDGTRTCTATFDEAWAETQTHTEKNGDKTNHTYGDWTPDDENTHSRVCTNETCPDENQGKETKPHEFDDDKDATCDTCGYIRTVVPDTYTVTFEASGGMVQPTSMVTNADGTLESLPTPTRGGSYRFAGWYTEKRDGTRITTDTVFKADTTVYAHWTHTGGSDSDDDGTYYTLTFETNGGSKIASERFRANATVDLSGYTPTRRGCAFTGCDVSVKASLDSFADEDNVSAWAQDAMSWAVASGLMQGRNGNVLDPQGTATRAEAAAMLHRFAEK